MSCYLYGIVESNAVKNFGAIGFETAGEERGKVEAILSRNIAAVIGPAPKEDFGLLNKERLVKALLTHQETLEIIMKSQFILPCKFGTVLKDTEEVNEILLQNERRLEEWIRKMKDRFEMDVVATWDTKKILKEIAADDSEILNWTRTIQELPLEKQENEKIAFGMRLSAKLRAHADQFASQIRNTLRGVSESYATHDVMNDEMVLNASFLLEGRREEHFFKAVDDLDLKFEGKFNFRCIGPLPPYSFAMILVKKFDPGELRWASEVLELRNDQDLGAVKQAYKEKSRKCHPDIHPELDGREFKKLHEAYELLVDYHEGGCQTRKVDLFRVNGKV